MGQRQVLEQRAGLRLKRWGWKQRSPRIGGQRAGRWPTPWLLGAALALPLGTALMIEAPAARALVPFVYLPQSKELEGAGLGIAQAAARLLRVGQAEDAARLAELGYRGD